MNKVESALQSLEERWALALPEAFRRLYRRFEEPYISPCEFLTLGELLNEEERWLGMLPQFLPIGQDSEENFYGFYVGHGMTREDYPVLFWNHEYDHYYPVASGFGPFLGWCVIQGRYAAQDEMEEDDPEYAAEEQQRRAFADY